MPVPDADGALVEETTAVDLVAEVVENGGAEVVGTLGFALATGPLLDFAVDFTAGVLDAGVEEATAEVVEAGLGAAVAAHSHTAAADD